MFLWPPVHFAGPPHLVMFGEQPLKTRRIKAYTRHEAGIADQSSSVEGSTRADAEET